MILVIHNLFRKRLKVLKSYVEQVDWPAQKL